MAKQAKNTTDEVKAGIEEVVFYLPVDNDQLYFLVSCSKVRGIIT